MRQRRGSTLGAVAAAVLTALVTTSCGFSTTDLAFTNDERLRILAPREREKVRIPVTIQWEIDDFEVTGPARGEGDNEGYFAVFVDASPMPPGEPLRWVARKDRSCRPADGCPAEEYLAARGVYTTTETELVLETLRNPNREGRREFHEVTVVLLDRNGVRIGESAWHVRFEVDREVRS